MEDAIAVIAVQDMMGHTICEDLEKIEQFGQRGELLCRKVLYE